MSQGSPPFSLSLIDWYSIGWTLATAALAAAFTALVDSVLPDLKEKGLIDATLFTLLTTLLHAARKFVTDSRMIRVLVAMAALGCLGSTSYAEEIAVMIDDSKPGAYLVEVDAAGRVTARPTKMVRPGQSPTNPTDPPPPTTLSTHVQQLTSAALVEGGSHSTAASLSVAYSVVANQVDSGGLTLPQVGPALKALCDGLIPQGEAAIWAKWRIGVGDALTTRLGTKADAIAALRAISDGAKSAVNGSAAATGAKAIDWTALFNLLLPILLKLLESFLNPNATS
jgi:hypothetical protein